MSELLSSPEATVCLLCGSDRARVVCRFQDSYAMRRCRACGLVYLNPRPRQEAMAGLYDEDYYASHNLQYATGLSDEALEALLRQWERGVASEVGRFKQPPGRLLEVGCAAGLFLKAAQRCGWDTMGVEVSEFAVRFARERLKLNVVCGTLPEAPLPPASCDVVSLFMVLEHVPDPIGLLRQIRRLLKPDGVVLIKVPNIRCLESLVFGGRWYPYSFPHHTCMFSPATIRRCVQQAGLVVRHLETYRHLSNWVNPTSRNGWSTLTTSLASSNGHWRLARAVLRWPYRVTTSVVDRGLLLGEHLRVVAGSNGRG